MKDYERYMNRQKVSEIGMETLLKLETERPEKRRKPAPRWVKYGSLAACLALVVGLLTPPALRGIGQLFQPAEEELVFHEVDSVPFTDQAISGGMGMNAMEPAEAAELFGCAPDDFVGLLETMGLDKFDMEYYTVDMVGQGDGGYHFLMKGDCMSPREKPENWDETPEISWEMWQGLSAVMPYNHVWLEIYEGHSYLDEAEWKALEPQTFHGHQVVAARSANSDYYAAAAFDVESGGKTYGVLYSVTLYGAGDAKELVTKMVSCLTTNGLFIEGRAAAQVKTTGFYRMETGDQDHEAIRLAPPSLHFDSEGCIFFQSVLSSYSGRGDYTVADGRVTVRSDKGSYVFDILDENTLRFVAAASSQPERYKLGAGEEATPMVTDGAVFRWQETVEKSAELPALTYAELTQPYAEVDFYKALEGNESRELTKDELAKVFPASDGEAGVNYRWTGTAWLQDDGNLRAVVITGEKMDETETVTITTSREEGLSFTRNQTKKNGKVTYFGEDNTKYVTGMDLVRCFYVNEPGHFNNAPGACWCYAQYEVAGGTFPMYTQVRTSVSQGSLLENEVFNTKWFDTVNKTGLWFYTVTGNGKVLWKLPEVEEAAEETPQVEITGTYYRERDGVGLESNAYLSVTGTAPRVRVCYEGRDCLCDGASYDATGGRVTYVCNDCGSKYAFDMIDEDTLRFAADGSSVGDLSDQTVFRHPHSGEELTTVFQFGSWPTHHPELEHNVEVTHHVEPTHHVEEDHHSDSHH